MKSCSLCDVEDEEDNLNHVRRAGNTLLNQLEVLGHFEEVTRVKVAKSGGGLKGGRLRSESSQKLWLLTLNHFTLINKTLNERVSETGKTKYEHSDLQPYRLRSNLEC